MSKRDAAGKLRHGRLVRAWLPDDLVAEIEKLMEPLGLTFRAVVIAALREWVRREKKKIEQ